MTVELEDQLNSAVWIDAVFCVSCGQPDLDNFHDPARCPGMGGTRDEMTVAEALAIFDEACAEEPDMSDEARPLHCAIVAGRKRRDEPMDMLREANSAFGNYVGPEPGVPEISTAGKSWLLSFSRRLAELAAEARTASALLRTRGLDLDALLVIRTQLLMEETGEWAEALASGDIEKAFNELADIDYVTTGNYLTLGLGDLRLAGLRELHDANMSKLVVCEVCEGEGTIADGLDEAACSMSCPPCKGVGYKPIIDEAGRWVKGPNYHKPDFDRVLRESQR